MEFKETFGETIKKLREEQNLPLRKVAKVLKIDTSMLGKIEKNTRKPTKQMIEKLAKYFKVSNKDLLITFLSDSVAYQIIDQKHLSREVLRVAEQKVKYFKTQKTS